MIHLLSFWRWDVYRKRLVENRCHYIVFCKQVLDNLI